MSRDKVFDHDFDGIQEYDNKLPNWWLYILYGSIIFGLGYWLYYHTYDIGKLPRERHRLDSIAAAEAQLAKLGDSEVTNEALKLVATIPTNVEAGKAIFEQTCVTCHNPMAEGNIGPNLTDAYWIHGGAPLDIYNTVVNGVAEKGMAAWMDQLGPIRVRNVVGYVLTIRDTNVPGKAPEGEIWVEGESTESGEATPDAVPEGDGAVAVPGETSSP